MPNSSQSLSAFLSSVPSFIQHTSGLHLRPYQVAPIARLQDSIFNHRGDTIIIVFPRQSGKDEFIIQLMAYLLNFYSEYPVSMVAINPTYKPQTVNALLRFDQVLSRNPVTAGGWSKKGDFIRLLDQARISFLSGDSKSNVVGATASLLLIINEAQDINPTLYQHKFLPMAASTRATRLLAGTLWTSTTLLSQEIRHARFLEGQDGRQRVFMVDADHVRQILPNYGAHVDAVVARWGRQHPLVKTQYFNEEIDATTGMFNAARMALIFSSPLNSMLSEFGGGGQRPEGVQPADSENNRTVPPLNSTNLEFGPQVPPDVCGIDGAEGPGCISRERPEGVLPAESENNRTVPPLNSTNLEFGPQVPPEVCGIGGQRPEGVLPADSENNRTVPPLNSTNLEFGPQVPPDVCGINGQRPEGVLPAESENNRTVPPLNSTNLEFGGGGRRPEGVAFLLDLAGQDEAVMSDPATRLANPSRDSAALSIAAIDTSTVATLNYPSYTIIHRLEWTGQNHLTIFGQLKNLAENWLPRYIVIDATGVGEGLWALLDKAFPGKVIPVKFTSAVKSDIGYRFLALINTGRFKDMNPTQKVEEQYSACQSEVLPGPNKTLRWGVPDGTRDPEGKLIHDDFVLADALVTQLDDLDWSISSPTLIIERETYEKKNASTDLLKFIDHNF